MNHQDDIIDVTPTDHATEHAAPEQKPRSAQERRQAPPAGAAKPYYTFDGTSWHPESRNTPPHPRADGPVPVDARILNENGKPNDAQPKSRLGGVARIAAGGVCTLVGIPMLILPGPGLVAIGGGIYLMASGAKRVFAK